MIEHALLNELEAAQMEELLDGLDVITQLDLMLECEE